MKPILVLAAVIVILNAAPAFAEVVCIEVTAEIATVDDPDDLLDGEVQVGQIITAYYTFESATPDANSLPTVGDYWHDYALFGIEVQAGSLTFETDPDNVEFLVEICNDHGTPPSDNYLLRSYNNLCLPSGISVNHISWQLDDPSCTALDSDQLPKDPPVVSDWQSWFGLVVEGEDPNEPWSQYFVRAHATSATAQDCQPHPICIEIQAEVAHVDDLHGLLGGAIYEGQTITGKYVYNLVTADSNTLPTVGDYWHSTIPYGIQVEAGGLVFETDPENTDFLVEIVNDHGSPDRDNHLLRSYNNLPLSDDITVEHIAWQLDDPTATAIESEALPTAPPVLSDWESIFGLTLQGASIQEPWEEYFVRAHVNQAEFCFVSSVDPPSGRAEGLAGIQATASPNPFGVRTTIQYTTPIAGPVAIEVFDVAGRRIRTLTCPWQGREPHRVEWDGADDLGKQVRSGVYVYRICTSTSTCSGTLLLVR
jgi:hypothetical protein